MAEEWAWRIGMLVLMGVPAIIGGGVVWALIPKWSAVIIWGVIVLAVLAVLMVGGEKKKEEAPAH